MKNRIDLQTQIVAAIFPNSSGAIQPQTHQDCLKEINNSLLNRTDDIINNLTTGGTDKALSAEQGKILAALIPGEAATATFESADLDVNYDLLVNHGKNTNFVKATILDGDGIEQQTAGIFTVVDADNIKISLNAPIAGTWRYILQYF